MHIAKTDVGVPDVANEGKMDSSAGIGLRERRGHGRGTSYRDEGGIDGVHLKRACPVAVFHAGVDCVQVNTARRSLRIALVALSVDPLEKKGQRHKIAEALVGLALTPRRSVIRGPDWPRADRPTSRVCPAPSPQILCQQARLKAR